jgi:hypothetical protein
MFWPDLGLMEQASKKRQLSASKKVNYGPVAIRVVKPWVSHRQAFGRDRDLDYFSARNWYVNWQISPNEGGFQRNAGI